jgi:hypothetical protein
MEIEVNSLEPEHPIVHMYYITNPQTFRTYIKRKENKSQNRKREKKKKKKKKQVSTGPCPCPWPRRTMIVHDAFPGLFFFDTLSQDFPLFSLVLSQYLVSIF